MTNHAPSDAEKHEIAAASGRQNQRPPRVAIDIRQPINAPAQISPTHSDGEGWQTRLKDALGTSSSDFVDIEMARLMTIFQNRAGVIDARAVNAALAVVDGLKPQNEIEAMLALQMAVTHGLAMMFSARLYSGATETIPQQDSAALTLSRLQRAFTTQMDSLSNMRRGGRQVVEHVHVYPGGQAIVGNVTHRGGYQMKIADKPMQRMTNEPLPLREASRCGARTRQGKPCQSPIVKGKRRCRMHGGAPGSGAPRGERNGNYRHGFYTAEAMAERRAVRVLLRKL
jgi:hypothetical protein